MRLPCKYDIKIKLYWKNYIYQSSFAAVSVFIIFLILTIEHAVVVASIGSTAFIVFSMPNSIAATPKRVIGGHMIGFLSGSLIGIIAHGPAFYLALVYAIAVGVTLLGMVVADMEHPPTAGTALGIAMTGYSREAAMAIMTSVVILALIHKLARPYIKDLV